MKKITLEQFLKTVIANWIDIEILVQKHEYDFEPQVLIKAPLYKVLRFLSYNKYRWPFYDYLVDHISVYNNTIIIQIYKEDPLGEGDF